MKIIFGQIISKRFSMSRHRFDGGGFGEDEVVEDYVKKLEQIYSVTNSGQGEIHWIFALSFLS